MESGAWAFETRGNSQEKEQEELQLDEQCSLSNLEVGESMTEERGHDLSVWSVERGRGIG